MWATAAVVDHDQRANLTLSSAGYKQRMDSIYFAMEINGVRVEYTDTELLPGGNFRIDNPGLVEDGNQYVLEMLPSPRQFDRFDGYSVAYQWTPATCLFRLTPRC